MRVRRVAAARHAARPRVLPVAGGPGDGYAQVQARFRVLGLPLCAYRRQGHGQGGALCAQRSAAAAGASARARAGGGASPAAHHAQGAPVGRVDADSGLFRMDSDCTPPRLALADMRACQGYRLDHPRDV